MFFCPLTIEAFFASLDRSITTHAYTALQFGWMGWAAFGAVVCGVAWIIHPTHSVRMHFLTSLICWGTLISGASQLTLVPVQPHLGSNIIRFIVFFIWVSVCIYIEVTSERAWNKRQEQRAEEHEASVQLRAETHAAEVLATAHRLIDKAHDHEGQPE